MKLTLTILFVISSFIGYSQIYHRNNYNFYELYNNCSPLDGEKDKRTVYYSLDNKPISLVIKLAENDVVYLIDNKLKVSSTQLIINNKTFSSALEAEYNRKFYKLCDTWLDIDYVSKCEKTIDNNGRVNYIWKRL